MNPSKASLIQFIMTPYFRFKAWWPVWFYILNRKSRKLFKENPYPLSGESLRVFRELEENGVAVTTLEALFPDVKLSDLKTYVEKRSQEPYIQTKKEFYHYLCPPKDILDFSNPFVPLILRDTVFGIVNNYMGMWSKLKNYILAKTEPVTPGTPPVQSQRWHRDPQEKKFCKMFIYLSDVDQTSGPFIYVPQSTYKKKYGHLFPQKPPRGSYPEESLVEKAIPSEAVRVMTGKAGTVIFCDTTGLHRGGYATQKPRIMFTASFAAPSFIEKSWFLYSETTIKGKNLSKEILYALQS